MQTPSSQDDVFQPDVASSKRRCTTASDEVTPSQNQVAPHVRLLQARSYRQATIVHQIRRRHATAMQRPSIRLDDAMLPQTIVCSPGQARSQHHDARPFRHARQRRCTPIVTIKPPGQRHLTSRGEGVRMHSGCWSFVRSSSCVSHLVAGRSCTAEPDVEHLVKSVIHLTR